MLRFEDHAFDYWIPESWFKYLLLPSFLLAVFGQLGLEYSESTEIRSLSRIALFLNIILLLSWYYRRSIYRRIKLYRSTDIAKAFIILYALAKIQHWPYQDELLVAALATALLPYLYFNLTQKRPLSTWIAKIGLGLYFICILLAPEHLPYLFELSSLGILLLNLYALFYRKTQSLIHN